MFSQHLCTVPPGFPGSSRYFKAFSNRKETFDLNVFEGIKSNQEFPPEKVSFMKKLHFNKLPKIN